MPLPASFEKFTFFKLMVFEVFQTIIFVVVLARVGSTELGFWPIRWGAQTAKAATTSLVGTNTCQVSIQDIEGIEHVVEVTASTLYEAIALGILAIEKNKWAGEIPGGTMTVTVCAQEPTVQHKVQIQKFKRWLEQPGTTSADRLARQHILKILER